MPEKGSSTASGLCSSMKSSTSCLEKASLYFIQRRPGRLLLSWYETLRRVRSALTDRRPWNRSSSPRRSLTLPPLGETGIPIR